ncbi:MAG TPA: multicopper oxidase domain-containing protein, partial [Gemmatimonadales bacterium]|nr:multicopper oxidase domain-containing protein [Gemmatimonadales bacterium]
MRAKLPFVAAVLVLSSGHVKTVGIESAAPNDNRKAAGRLADGVLTVRLEAREVLWRPESQDGAAIPIYAFAEAGQRATIPGPMIRVRAGTEIHATVRNRLTKPLRLQGLHGRGGAPDSTIVAPDSTQALSFRADVPGTYYYWARTEPEFPAGLGFKRDAVLLGAFIVDSAGALPPTRERVIVLSSFYDTVLSLGPKPSPADRVLHREFVTITGPAWFVTTVNGKSWPYTERLSYTVGDTVRFRVINGGRFPHPMHLHGFYFDVHARGDAQRDTTYAPNMRREAVTEWMPAGTTMSMTWTPTRPGNWLFHCHLVTHMSDALRLPSSERRSMAHANHAESGMAGLVIGIRVAPRPGVGVAAEPPARRRMRLFVTERAGVYGNEPGYSYVLQEGPTPPAPDSILTPSSTLVLRQDEPTEIAVINSATHATTVHWHGLEIESVYDGVGDWSGWGRGVAPVIAPGDSFVVRLTPPRAGTFIYHSHVDEAIQLASGLYGTLLVIPPGGTSDTTERVFLIGMAGPHDEAPPAINGSPTPAPVELRAGVPHRFRFINIAPMETRTVQLLAGDTVQSRRAVAKDGADLAPA